MDTQSILIAIGQGAVIVLALWKLFSVRFDTIDKRFEAVDRRFDRLERRFENLEQRIDRHLEGHP